MTEKFGKINTTILKMGQVIDALTNTINNLTIRTDETDRCLATLEQERELRKKPNQTSVETMRSYTSKW